eukprot:gb/GEZN01013355.1/.p1 GENE.gb/GEZN01013355.1/~~gb/GEZN01013355.1/.p1  ORF type:complete len:278 (-),score=22.30 gb/GEZN01013355.1/:85-918(-)
MSCSSAKPVSNSAAESSSCKPIFNSAGGGSTSTCPKNGTGPAEVLSLKKGTHPRETEVLGLDQEEEEQDRKIHLQKTLTSSDIVTIDVGGTLFRSRAETLTRNSLFFQDLLLSDGIIRIDLTKPLFLDLEPKAFRLILNYFRTQKPGPLLKCLASARYLRDRDRNANMEDAETGFCRRCFLPFWRIYSLYSYSCDRIANASNDRCRQCGDRKVIQHGYRPSDKNKFISTEVFVFLPLVSGNCDFLSAEEQDLVEAVTYQLLYLQVKRFSYLNKPSWQ